MPELPEVETICRGLVPVVCDKTIGKVTVRRRDLRWPVPEEALQKALPKARIEKIERRGKYLLFSIGSGVMIVHLGMSGVLRHMPESAPFGKHDHFDIAFGDDSHLRLNDPRRFGSVLWTTADPAKHKLIAPLGPEPLSEDFDPRFLHDFSRKRRGAIKNFLMNSHVVVGVGNIYAAEALFLAGINPARPAEAVTLADCEALVDAIKKTLKAAIEQGGTTLKDYRNGEGKPGYFQQSLNVYGRLGEACPVCKTPIEQVRLGGRASAFCPRCQKI